MKLRELTEARITKHILGNIPVVKRKSSDGIVDFRKLKHLGSGVEGDVYGTTAHGVAIKVVRIEHGIEDAKNNAFLRFVSLCLANTSNPFFPRIKSAKVYEIPTGKDMHPEAEDDVFGGPGQRAHLDDNPDWSNYLLIIAMEQLVQLDDIPYDMAEKIYNRLGMTLSAVKAQEDKKKRGKEALIAIGDLGLTRRALNTVKRNTTNKQFQQALDTLAPLFAKFGGDTHSGNFMFRKTGNGLQLVFIDPLDPHGYGE